PLCFFKIPPPPGNTWSVECKTDDGKTIEGSFVAGGDKVALELSGKSVEVPAVTVTSKGLREGTEEMSITYWFAKDLGMVKQRVRHGKHESTLELIEYKPAP